MQGYEVWSNDDHLVGVVDQVVGDVLVVRGDFVLLLNPNTGDPLLKLPWWRAIPRALTRADDELRQIRLSIARDLFLEAPRAKRWGRKLDPKAVSDFYGIPVEAELLLRRKRN